MKNMKTIILLLSTGFAASLFFSFTNNKSNSILTMQVAESTMGGTDRDNAIIIVDENGDAEIIALAQPNAKDPAKNLITVNKALNSTANKGYKLIAVAQGGGNNLGVVTYTFIKE